MHGHHDAIPLQTSIICGNRWEYSKEIELGPCLFALVLPVNHDYDLLHDIKNVLNCYKMLDVWLSGNNPYADLAVNSEHSSIARPIFRVPYQLQEV